MEIWTEGFGELRGYRPEGRCRGCEFAPACGGGCWLQRRAGTHCFKEQWQLPGLAGSAAGMAVCLGLAGFAVAQCRPGPEAMAPQVAPVVPPPARGERLEPTDQIPDGELQAQAGPTVESLILAWYAATLPDPKGGGHYPPLAAPGPGWRCPPELAGDPAAELLTRLFTGASPGELAARAERVEGVAGSRCPSLSLASLAWRHLVEPLLDGPEPVKRGPEERKALAEALAALGGAAKRWRGELVAGSLDPYLARGRLPLVHRFEMSKAYRPPPPWLTLLRDTQRERWGEARPGTEEPDPLTADYLTLHPYAAEMALVVEHQGGPQPKLVRPGEPELPGGGEVGPFALLRTASGEATTLAIAWSGEQEVRYSVKAGGGADYTYIDLLALVAQGHGEALARAASAPGERTALTNPLFLPLYRQAAREPAPAVRDRPGPPAEASAWLADFWLF